MKKEKKDKQNYLEPVSIDTSYPSEAVIENIRKLKVPKLKKLTKSLF